MSRPTHQLRHEHRVIEKVLRALDGICWRLENATPVPVPALRQTLDFLRHYADRLHHAKEEQHLFPLLEQSGIEDEHGALGFLRQEHTTERELLSELELALDEYQAGDPHASARFALAARQFSQHLLHHIQQEDALLFRLAEALLDEPDKEELTWSLLHAQGQVGAHEAQHYEQTAEALEKAWTI
ncbi:MAG: hemerythrin domain-containing protein [Acidobacteria bacterium]|nr:hemerythrin domain-containing protein [Acidobacteriota bacterium]MBI3426438.1 hemerythrin domain-containing protein [Acidobacteriota bacterium]